MYREFPIDFQFILFRSLKNEHYTTYRLTQPPLPPFFLFYNYKSVDVISTEDIKNVIGYNTTKWAIPGVRWRPKQLFEVRWWHQKSQGPRFKKAWVHGPRWISNYGTSRASELFQKKMTLLFKVRRVLHDLQNIFRERDEDLSCLRSLLVDYVRCCRDGYYVVETCCYVEERN